MLTQTGDIWTVRQVNDWVVITTNGTIRKDGALVMGRGIALEAAKKYPGLQKMLGGLVSTNGLQLEVLHAGKLIIFPVKYHYSDKANINLILKSTIQLVDAAKGISGRILMPRVGCGNGKLDWAEVEPMLRHYLKEDRYIVFNKP